jgi:nitrate/nitrite-specific signal transduction histidine kinase
MSEAAGDNSTRPRLPLGVKLAAIFVALAVLPMVGASYYAIIQAQAEESPLQPGTIVLIGAALTGIITLVAAILLARSITRPVRHLSDAAIAVKSGQPFEPADIADVTTRSDEIAHLGHSFSDMVTTLHRRMTELDMAFEIGQDIAASVEVDETLQAILDRVRDVIAYDAAEITLYDRRENALFVKAWRGKKGFVDTRGKSYRIGVGLTGQIAKDRKSLLIGDAHTDAGKAVPTGKTGILTLSVLVRSILGVPLIIRGRLVGTLELVSSRAGAFTEHDQRLLETIAPQAALAIEKAQLVLEREQKLREEIKQLRIEVDQSKRQRQVSAITETQYFQQLAKKATELRKRAEEDK